MFSSDQILKIEKEISSKVDGKTLFDEFSRGRYSTDASVYQIKPIGVVLPKDTNDVLNVMEYSQKNSIPLLARGGGKLTMWTNSWRKFSFRLFKTSE
jgi:FAD/FMN-containing dehydrogenase